jgi:hypothetical protein
MDQLPGYARKTGSHADFHRRVSGNQHSRPKLNRRQAIATPLENSEVWFDVSVAVAVITVPLAIATGNATVKDTVPMPSVVTVTEKKYFSPRPGRRSYPGG